MTAYASAAATTSDANTRSNGHGLERGRSAGGVMRGAVVAVPHR